MKHYQPPTIDFLSQFIDRLRPYLDASEPLKQRARDFWAGVVAARDLAASDVIETDFLELAATTGLTADLASHRDQRADETVRHLIRWGQLGRNPFGKLP